MAGARIIFPDFRDEQADSRYPFADTATLRSSSIELSLPREGFIDAVIYTINGAVKAYLSQLVIDGSNVTIVVGTEDTIEMASATYNPLSVPDNGYLALYDVYNRPAGALIATRECLAFLSGWPIGTHAFSLDATEFVSSLVIPAQETGVRAIQSEDELNFLTGDVWLIGDAGVVIRQESEEVIRVDITGEPLFKRLLCEGTAENYSPGPFLQTINGCGPDEYGNFNITVVGENTPDSIMRIYPQDGQLKIGLVGKKVV